MEPEEDESVRKTRVEETVRRTKELTMKGVNFWELKKYEKRALKPNWLAQMREYVETGTYNNPIAYNKQTAANNMPSVN